MSKLYIFGIEWEIVSDNGNPTKPAYIHKDVVIAWEPRTGTWQSTDVNGKLIFAREMPSACIKDTNVFLLDRYSDKILASWEDNEEEIPCYFEEAKEEKEVSQEENRRDTIPDAIFECYTD